jgi:subtilisin family serine protease
MSAMPTRRNRRASQGLSGTRTARTVPSVMAIEALERRDCPAAIAIIGTKEVSEATGETFLRVRLSESIAKPVSVDYFLRGDATFGRDYRLSEGARQLTAPTGTLTFKPGETLKKISIGIVNDTAREQNESLSLNLFRPRGATLSGSTSATITIKDDDSYTASIIGPSRLQAGATGTYTLQLSAPATQAHTFYVNTEDRSAFTPTDYAALTKLPLTFTAGQSAKTFTVSTRANVGQEADESFSINVSTTTAGMPPIEPTSITIIGNGVPSPPSGPVLTTATFTHDYGWGIVNASASVAKLLGRTTAFPEVKDLGGVNWGNDVVRAPEAWSQGYTGKGIVVAVIDTGVDYTHPALQQSIWVNTREVPNDGIDNDNNGFTDDVRGWDFVDTDNNPMDEVSAGGGHGTHVAGSIAAVGSAFGPRGVAYGSKIMPIRVLGAGGGTNQAVADGIRYAATNGAHVINLSLGSPGAVAPAIRDAISRATALGAIVVAAAGNDREPSPSAPASLAEQSGVISVGAINQNLRLGVWPRPYGPPGGSAYAGFSPSLKHVVAPGENVTSSVPQGYPGATTSPAGTFAALSGTSMAAPHVAGVVALMLGTVPNPKAPGVRDRVVNALVTTSQQPPPLSPAALAAAAANRGATGVVTARIVSPTVRPLSAAPAQAAPANVAVARAFVAIDMDQARRPETGRTVSARPASPGIGTIASPQLLARLVTGRAS